MLIVVLMDKISGKIFPSGIAADSYKKAVDSAIQRLSQEANHDASTAHDVSVLAETPSYDFLSPSNFFFTFWKLKFLPKNVFFYLSHEFIALIDSLQLYRGNNFDSLFFFLAALQRLLLSWQLTLFCMILKWQVD